MNLVFEDKNKILNLYVEGDTIPSGEDRICVCPYVNRLRVFKDNQFSVHNIEDSMIYGDEIFNVNIYQLDELPDKIKYIIPVGVHEEPLKWSGIEGNGSIFDLINPTYLQHLQEGRAYIMFDSSLEGYHTNRFFDYAHDECTRLNIPIKNVIWVSGNSIIEERAEEWEKETGKECIRVLGYSHFQYDINGIIDFFNGRRQYIPTWQDHFEYKKKNYPLIKDYNFLNRKPRAHRIALFNRLFHDGLLDRGLVSMNPWEYAHECNIDGWFGDPVELEHSVEYTPMRWNGEDNMVNAQEKISRLNEVSMLNSWFTVVSEARFEDSEGTIFLSEKLFKPIACSHPFVVLGNKHTLRELKKLGFYTYDCLIDESYDELDNMERLEAVRNIINDYRHLKNHLEWWQWLRPRIEYNRLVLKFNSTMKPPVGFHKLNELCGTIIDKI